jgi:preprotein translocase subunit SecD
MMKSGFKCSSHSLRSEGVLRYFFGNHHLSSMCTCVYRVFVSVESLFSFIQKKRESRTSCDGEEEEEKKRARQYPTRTRERNTREKKKKQQMKCTRARLGLTRFTSFDNQIIKSDGTDKCASSLALRASSRERALFSPPFSLSFQLNNKKKKKKKMSNEDRATTGANKSSQQKRLEAYRSCPSRRRLALSKPRA